MAGIYGVMAHATASRRREFGIRLALGADSRHLLWIVMAGGGLLIVGGLAFGIAAAVVLTRFLGAQLYGIEPTDLSTFAIVSVLLAVVALAACLNPARRAVKLDPAEVLRYE
jgi:ABC-type antimicrobial peptide transport system permease subunit